MPLPHMTRQKGALCLRRTAAGERSTGAQVGRRSLIPAVMSCVIYSVFASDNRQIGAQVCLAACRGNAGEPHSGHKSSIAGRYNKAEYLDERRVALEQWGDFILAKVEAALTPQQSNNRESSGESGGKLVSGT